MHGLGPWGATDAEHGGPLPVRPDDGLGTAVAAQLVEVAQRRLRSRQDDDVGLKDVVGVVGIEKMYARVLLQGVEVGVVRQVLQHHHADVHPSPFQLERLLRQRHAVLLLDVNVGEVGDDAQYGHAADVFQHAAPLVEEPHVAAELVDDDALDKPSVFRRLQGDAAIYRGEDAPSVDVAHQQHVGPGMAGHRQVYEVAVAQVDFGHAARPLHHDRVVAQGQTVEGIAHLLPEVSLLSPPSPKKVIGIAVADRASVKHYLARVVALWLQQQGVHVGAAGNAGGLGLHSLGAPYLQPVWCGVAVQRHVLGLEGCRMVAVLKEDAAEGSGHDALSYVASCACQHQGVERPIH